MKHKFHIHHQISLVPKNQCSKFLEKFDKTSAEKILKVDLIGWKSLLTLKKSIRMSGLLNSEKALVKLIFVLIQIRLKWHHICLTNNLLD